MIPLVEKSLPVYVTRNKDDEFEDKILMAKEVVWKREWYSNGGNPLIFEVYKIKSTSRLLLLEEIRRALFWRVVFQTAYKQHYILQYKKWR